MNLKLKCFVIKKKARNSSNSELHPPKNIQKKLRKFEGKKNSPITLTKTNVVDLERLQRVAHHTTWKRGSALSGDPDCSSSTLLRPTTSKTTTTAVNSERSSSTSVAGFESKERLRSSEIKEHQRGDHQPLQSCWF